MPRCQRTFRPLGPGETTPGRGDTRWECSFCEDREEYTVVREPDLLQYAGLAEVASHRDFGKPSDHQRPILFLWGMRPECVLESPERRYDIYLQRGSDPYQSRLQIGHEVFHRTCSQGRIFHWTHEMLACLFSVRLLRQHGWDEYASRVEEQYVCQAQRTSFSEMRGADPSRLPYPVGLYGRAYITGAVLADVVGWNTLCRLARCINPLGTPDIDAWQARLPGDEACRVAEILRNGGELVYTSAISGN